MRIVVPVMVMLAVLAGCGEDEPLTVQQYAETVCSALGGDFIDDDVDTWGDVSSTMREGLALVDVKPPDELREYHQAQVAAAEAVLAFADDQPQKDEVNPFMFLAAPNILALGMALDVADESLDDDTRSVLVEHGCIDEES